MSETPTIVWKGQSDKGYTYLIYISGTSFKEMAGNYIFAKETKPGVLDPMLHRTNRESKPQIGRSRERGVCQEKWSNSYSCSFE